MRLRLVAAIGFLAPSLALANGISLPDTVAPAIRPGSSATSYALETNFGFLESVDGGPWTWICHETVLPGTSSVTPLYFEGPGERLLATVRAIGVANDPNHSLFHSPDGCDWNPAGGLENVLVRDVATDPLNPDHVLACSSTGAGATNGVWTSTNGGVSFSKTSLDLPERFFRTVKFSRTNPMVAYTSATWYMPQGAFLYRSADGGATWTEHSIDFSPGGTLQTQVDVVAVSPTNDLVAYVRTDGSTDYLLRTTNGGVAFHEVFSIDEDIRAVEYDASASTIWLAAKDRGTFTSTDGVTFTQLVTGPRSRGFQGDARGTFAAANDTLDGWALGVNTAASGTAFTPIFSFDQLSGTRPCPQGSDVAAICAPLFPALAEKLGITPSPSPTPTNPGDDDDDGGGCACATPAQSAGTPWAIGVVLFVGAGVLAFRRRR